MKNRIIIILVALIATLSLSAQSIKVYKNSDTTPVATYNGRAYKVKAQGGNTLAVYWKKETTATATYENTMDTKYRVVIDNADSNLLLGKFSVGPNKQVQFTKSNLFWDGSAFKFEENQTDYQASWVKTHVSHFYWTKTAAASYARDYYDGTNTTNDVPFFAESTGGLTVEGTSGLFALSKDEWQYLISSRTNATNLRKYGVSVSNNGKTYTNCLIIAPDGYSNTSKPMSTTTSYTLDEVNSLGLVCLPAVGNGNSYADGMGKYWSSSPYSSTQAYTLYFYDNRVNVDDTRRDRVGAYASLRLVALPQD